MTLPNVWKVPTDGKLRLPALLDLFSAEWMHWAQGMIIPVYYLFLANGLGLNWTFKESQALESEPVYHSHHSDTGGGKLHY